MTYTQIFILILIVHFLADFALQTHEQATKKSTEMKWLLYHISTYTFVWSIVFFILPIREGVNNFFGWWIFTLLIFLTHFLTDFITSRIGTPFWKNNDPHNGFVVVGADQVVHYVTLWAILLEFTKIVV